MCYQYWRGQNKVSICCKVVMSCLVKLRPWKMKRLIDIVGCLSEQHMLETSCSSARGGRRCQLGWTVTRLLREVFKRGQQPIPSLMGQWNCMCHPTSSRCLARPSWASARLGCQAAQWADERLAEPNWPRTRKTTHSLTQCKLSHVFVTPHVSKPHDYVNHMFMRP
jgi:hypothetical protein